MVTSEQPDHTETVTEPHLRQAVRGLLIDPADRILLAELAYPKWTGWVLPGGGIDDGEDTVTALRRELQEEVGLAQAYIGPIVWFRRHVKPDMIEGHDGQFETVHLVPCRAFDPEPALTPEEMAAEYLAGVRWWSLAELANSSDRVVPDGLVSRVEQVLEFGAPADPPTIEHTE